MKNFLKKRIAEKRKEVVLAKKRRPLNSFKNKLKKSARNFRKALAKEGRVALIAEIKAASPSKGTIRKKFNLGAVAQAYDKYADTISVLTDKKFFNGSLENLRQAGKLANRPLLRKDFIIDEYQIYEARLYGANAVLLIANILTREQINAFIKIADSLKMVCLVEVDSIAGLKKVLQTKASILGINNRNLNTFKVDKNRFEKLVKKIPAKKRNGLVVVAESGYGSRKDVEKLKGIADAVLVGTSIMSSPNIKTKLLELSGRTLVKICGITNEKDANAAIKMGADFIGLNFYRKSPRYIEPPRAARIAKKLKGKVQLVGVFVNENAKTVEKIARQCNLDLLQFSGNESPDYIQGFKLPVIKAFHVKGRQSIGKINSFNANYVLLDAFKEGEFGGTGKSFDFSALKKLNDRSRLFIAGGLNPANVAKVVKEFKPFAVDVASGVEERPGKKSFAKMKKFINEVRNVQ